MKTKDMNKPIEPAPQAAGAPRHAGEVSPGQTKYVVTEAHGHQHLAVGDVVIMVEDPRFENWLLRVADLTLHGIAGQSGQYVHLAIASDELLLRKTYGQLSPPESAVETSDVLAGWQAVYLPNCKEPDVPIAIFQYADHAHRWAEQTYSHAGFVTKSLRAGDNLRWACSVNDEKR